MNEENPSEIDLSQLVRNLSLTVEQRLAEHQAALELMIELESAGRKKRAEPQ